MLAWQKAHQLTLDIYRTSKGFPADERFGLTSQLRCSASSISANIAEGCGRGSDAYLGRFLQMAMGSASEKEYHLLLTKDLGYLERKQADLLIEKVQETKRMLASFLKKLRADH